MLKSRIILVMVAVIGIVAVLWLRSYSQEPYAYDSAGKRDPFVSLITEDGHLLQLDREEDVKGLSVEGTIYDAQGISYVLVNGEVLKVGDVIGEYQVLKIHKDRIIFIKNGEPVEITVEKGGQ